jgi:transcription elongation GreA/GreB family factor
MAPRQKEPFQPVEDRLLAAGQDGEVDADERVTVLDLTTPAVHDHRIVGSARPDASEGEILPASPLASALLGGHVRDVVAIPSRRGNVHLGIVEIDEEPVDPARKRYAGQ